LNKWNKTRNSINKFFRLKNKQWLKILFTYKNKTKAWHMSIVIANSKRQCNDCLNKTEFSPKILYGHSTGNKAGLEPLIISLKTLLWFETTVHNYEIVIIPASKRLNKIYSRLIRYGYKVKIIEYINKKKEVYSKSILR